MCSICDCETKISGNSAAIQPEIDSGEGDAQHSAPLNGREMLSCVETPSWDGLGVLPLGARISSRWPSEYKGAGYPRRNAAIVSAPLPATWFFYFTSIAQVLFFSSHLPVQIESNGHQEKMLALGLDQYARGPPWNWQDQLWWTNEFGQQCTKPRSLATSHGLLNSYSGTPGYHLNWKVVLPSVPWYMTWQSFQGANGPTSRTQRMVSFITSMSQSVLELPQNKLQTFGSSKSFSCVIKGTNLSAHHAPAILKARHGSQSSWTALRKILQILLAFTITAPTRTRQSSTLRICTTSTRSIHCISRS